MGVEPVSAIIRGGGGHFLLFGGLVTFCDEEHYSLGDLLSYYGAHRDRSLGVVLLELRLRDVASMGLAGSALLRHLGHRRHLLVSLCSMAMLNCSITYL